MPCVAQSSWPISASVSGSGSNTRTDRRSPSATSNETVLSVGGGKTSSVGDVGGDVTGLCAASALRTVPDDVISATPPMKVRLVRVTRVLRADSLAQLGSGRCSAGYSRCGGSQMNEFVVGLDGSDHSRMALRWAAAAGNASGVPVRAVQSWIHPRSAVLPFVPEPVPAEEM